MMTKFVLNNQIFKDESKDEIERSFELYNEYYKPLGWLLQEFDEGCYDVYILVYGQIDLRDNEYVDLGERMTVTHRYFDIKECCMVYELEVV